MTEISFASNIAQILLIWLTTHQNGRLFAPELEDFKYLKEFLPFSLLDMFLEIVISVLIALRKEQECEFFVFSM